MGQQPHNKIYTRDVFQQYYQQTLTHEYFPSPKTFGFRKFNIQALKLHQLPKVFLNSTNSNHEPLIQQQTLRKKLMFPDTYPYSCLGLLLINFKHKSLCATGCLIGRNYVLTAASNIYDKQTSSFATQIKFVLNLVSSKGDIYLIKQKFYFNDKYIKEAEGSHRYNYAVLQILRKQSSQGKDYRNLENSDAEKEENPGLVYGYLGINTNFLGMQNIYIYGYSKQLSENNQTQYCIRGQKIDKLLCKDSSIGYKMPSCPSESGSPILIKRNQYYHIVGIHINSKKEVGSGLQFDSNMRATINQWIQHTEGSMNLSNKQINAMGVSIFIKYNWRNMTVINLDNNQIGNEGLVLLSKITWPILKQLHLNQNNISKLEIQPGSVKNLQHLNLAKNHVKEIDVLAEIPILTVLDLSQNKVEDIECIYTLKYLERINLNRNKITKITSEISRLTQLKKLHLSRNQIQTLPVQILKLKQLMVVSLDGNPFRYKESDVIHKLESSNVQVIIS